MEQMRAVIEASGAEIVTVALRRVDLSQKGQGSLIEAIPPTKYTYLPNSAGCYTAEEALRTLRLARELGGWDLVKLEVIGDPKTLLPDTEETLKAAKILVSEGFNVMAYTNDDLIFAKKLEDAGCSAVMPLAAPIGSGLGILNPHNISAIASTLKVPVLVDAGVGTASDACIAMELGCAGVLLNTALSSAKDPLLMAKAMKLAVEAGRLAYLGGRMPKRENASPSSPSDGLL
jgi:thiazole synthase